MTKPNYKAKLQTTKEYIMPTFEPWANFKQALKEIQSKLEPGITISLRYDDGVLYPQYTVRAQRKGKRETLGSYYTIEGANDALYSFKRTGIAVINEEEYKAIGIVKSINSNTPTITDEEKAKLTYVRIIELLTLNNMFTWQVFGEEVIKLKTEEDNVFVYFTPVRQSEFNKEHHEALSAQEELDAVFKDTPSERAASSELSEEQDMSDDEYNKMMGLDDEES